MLRRDRQLLLVLVLFVYSQIAAAREAGTTTVVFDATHEIVCSCTCGSETQTYAWEPNFDCARLNEIPCEYGEGSTSHLADCEKKAQKKAVAGPVQPLGSIGDEGSQSVADDPGRGAGDARIAATPPTSTVSGAIVARPAGPITPFPHLNSFNIDTGNEYLAWLDGISTSLFGGSFPGLVLPVTPTVVGQTYNGNTAWPIQPYALTVSSIQQQETIPGYVDTASSKVFDLQVVWLTGTLSTVSSSVTTGAIVVTATYVANPSQKLTTVLPLGANYPFGPGWPQSATSGPGDGGRPGLLADLQPEFPPVAGAEDACANCYTVANRDIARMKRDLKSCLKWGAAGAVVGGLVGLLGGNPWTVVGGAVVGAAVVDGACADTALDTYSDIIADFCTCLAENDCPPHPKCA